MIRSTCTTQQTAARAGGLLCSRPSHWCSSPQPWPCVCISSSKPRAHTCTKQTRFRSRSDESLHVAATTNVGRVHIYIIKRRSESSQHNCLWSRFCRCATTGRLLPTDRLLSIAEAAAFAPCAANDGLGGTTACFSPPPSAALILDLLSFPFPPDAAAASFPRALWPTFSRAPRSNPAISQRCSCAASHQLPPG